MARSTRSQDALLALVVLLTVFAVPALEVYVQLTDREDRWGPAVRGLFGLGFALSIGLGYRKWERDRAARSPRRVAPVSAMAPVAAPSPTHLQAGPRTRASLDPLHAVALAVIAAFLAGAALTYLVVWPREKSAPADSRQKRAAATSNAVHDQPAPVAQAEHETAACAANARYWCKNMLLDDVDAYRRDGLEPFDEFGKSADINSCAHWLQVQCEIGKASLTRVVSSAPDRLAVWCLKTVDAPAPRCF
jgi:hypothetical protein